MLFYTFTFVLIRTFIQVVHDDYMNTTSTCSDLLSKASAETIPDIRSAYFLTVMDIDNRSLKKTLEKYYIGFLASETTYASEEEIFRHACKMPYITSELLSWTAGVSPLLTIYILYLLYVKMKEFRKSKPAKQSVVEQGNNAVVELTKPPSRTPITHAKRRRESMRTNLDKDTGVRHRKRQQEDNSQPKQTSVLEKLTNLSPRLRNRLLAKDNDNLVDV